MAPIATRRRPAAGSQAALALLQPHATQKKPARLRFKSRGFSIGAYGVYKPAGRWFAGFQATPTRGIKTQTYVIFARRRIRNARNPPSWAQTSAASTFRASGTRNLQTTASQTPTLCRRCAPRLPGVGPRARHAPSPGTPTAHDDSDTHAKRHKLSAPLHPKAHTTFHSCASRSLMTPRASAPWTSTVLHTSHGVPQVPSHRAFAACQTRRAPRLACYLFGATFSSSQVHRNVKATRTSAPPAYPITPTPRLLTTTPPKAEPPPMPRLKMPE